MAYLRIGQSRRPVSVLDGLHGGHALSAASSTVLPPKVMISTAEGCISASRSRDTMRAVATSIGQVEQLRSGGDSFAWGRPGEPRASAGSTIGNQKSDGASLSGHCAPLEALELALRLQEEAIESGTISLAANMAFHVAIAERAADPLSPIVLRAMLDWLAAFHASAEWPPGLEALALEEHRVILARLSERNPAAAAEAMRTHR